MTTVVSHLGLPDKEVILLTSIFSVLGTSSRVNDELVFIRDARQSIDEIKKNTNENIKFIGNENRRSPGRLADIVFIDGDNRFSIEVWMELKESNPLTVPIIVSSRKSNKSVGQYTVQRPLMLKKLIVVLAEITNTKKEKKSSLPSILDVLVVDDSYPVRKYMEHTLAKLANVNISIDFAISGEEALEKIAEKKYGLIFLDVVMPGMDGYKVCKAIKSKYGSKVVMLTSKKSPFDKVRGTMSGCDAYLTKPPQEAQLKKVLLKCLEDISSFYRSA